MTIPNSKRISDLKNGNGVDVSFTFAYKVLNASNIVVVKTTDDTPIESVIPSNEYLTTLNPNQDTNVGGSIRFHVAPDNKTQFYILSDSDFTQTTDLTSGTLNGLTVMIMVDKTTMLCQELKRDVDRSIKVSHFDTKTDVDNYFNNLLSIEKNITTIQTNIVSIQALVDADKTTINNKIADANNIVTELQTLRTQFNDLVATVQGIETSVESKFNNIKNIESNIDSSKSEIKQMHDTVVAKSVDITNKVNEIQNALSLANTAILSLEQSYKLYQSERGEVDAVLRTMKLNKSIAVGSKKSGTLTDDPNFDVNNLLVTNIAGKYTLTGNIDSGTAFVYDYSKVAKALTPSTTTSSGTAGGYRQPRQVWQDENGKFIGIAQPNTLLSTELLSSTSISFGDAFSGAGADDRIESMIPLPKVIDLDITPNIPTDDALHSLYVSVKYNFTTDSWDWTVSNDIISTIIGSASDITICKIMTWVVGGTRIFDVKPLITPYVANVSTAYKDTIFNESSIPDVQEVVGKPQLAMLSYAIFSSFVVNPSSPNQFRFSSVKEDPITFTQAYVDSSHEFFITADTYTDLKAQSVSGSTFTDLTGTNACAIAIGLEPWSGKMYAIYYDDAKYLATSLSALKDKSALWKMSNNIINDIYLIGYVLIEAGATSLDGTKAFWLRTHKDLAGISATSSNVVMGDLKDYTATALKKGQAPVYVGTEYDNEYVVVNWGTKSFDEIPVTQDGIYHVESPHDYLPDGYDKLEVSHVGDVVVLTATNGDGEILTWTSKSLVDDGVFPVDDFKDPANTFYDIFSVYDPVDEWTSTLSDAKIYDFINVPTVTDKYLINDDTANINDLGIITHTCKVFINGGEITLTVEDEQGNINVWDTATVKTMWDGDLFTTPINIGVDTVTNIIQKFNGQFDEYWLRDGVPLYKAICDDTGVIDRYDTLPNLIDIDGKVTRKFSFDKPAGVLYAEVKDYENDREYVYGYSYSDGSSWIELGDNTFSLPAVDFAKLNLGKDGMYRISITDPTKAMLPIDISINNAILTVEYNQLTKQSFLSLLTDKAKYLFHTANIGTTTVELTDTVTTWIGKAGTTNTAVQGNWDELNVSKASTDTLGIIAMFKGFAKNGGKNKVGDLVFDRTTNRAYECIQENKDKSASDTNHFKEWFPSNFATRMTNLFNTFVESNGVVKAPQNSYKVDGLIWVPSRDTLTKCIKEVKDDTTGVDKTACIDANYFTDIKDDVSKQWVQLQLTDKQDKPYQYFKPIGTTTVGGRTIPTGELSTKRYSQDTIMDAPNQVGLNLFVDGHMIGKATNDVLTNLNDVDFIPGHPIHVIAPINREIRSGQLAKVGFEIESTTFGSIARGEVAFRDSADEYAGVKIIEGTILQSYETKADPDDLVIKFYGYKGSNLDLVELKDNANSTDSQSAIRLRVLLDEAYGVAGVTAVLETREKALQKRIEQLEAHNKINVGIEKLSSSGNKVGEIYIYNGKLYQCLKANTQTIIDETASDFNTNWKAISGAGGITEWTSGFVPAIGDEVLHDGVIFKCLKVPTDFTIAPETNSFWTAESVSEKALQTLQDDLDAELVAVQKRLADLENSVHTSKWVSGEDVTVGDIYIDANGKYWECKKAPPDLTVAPAENEYWTETSSADLGYLHDEVVQNYNELSGRLAPIEEVINVVPFLADPTEAAAYTFTAGLWYFFDFSNMNRGWFKCIRTHNGLSDPVNNSNFMPLGNQMIMQDYPTTFTGGTGGNAYPLVVGEVMKKDGVAYRVIKQHDLLATEDPKTLTDVFEVWLDPMDRPEIRNAVRLGYPLNFTGQVFDNDGKGYNNTDTLPDCKAPAMIINHNGCHILLKQGGVKSGRFVNDADVDQGYDATFTDYIAHVKIAHTVPTSLTDFTIGWNNISQLILQDAVQLMCVYTPKHLISKNNQTTYYTATTALPLKTMCDNVYETNDVIEFMSIPTFNKHIPIVHYQLTHAGKINTGITFYISGSGFFPKIEEYYQVGATFIYFVINQTESVKHTPTTWGSISLSDVTSLAFDEYSLVIGG